MASAGILALSLVVAPSEVDDAIRPEVHPVQLAYFALPFAAPPGSLLEQVLLKVQAPVPFTGGGDVGAAEISAATVTAPPTIDPAVDTHGAGAATLAATATPLEFGLSTILPPLLSLPVIGPIIGIALLFGPLIALVILACPPCALFNFLSYIPSYFGIYLPVPALPLAAAAAVEEAPTLTSEPPSSEPATAALPASAAAPEATPPADTETADVSAKLPSDETARVTPTESTEAERVPADVAPQTDEESTRPTAAGAPEPSAKPTGQPTTPRRILHGSAGEDQQSRPCDGVRSTAQNAATGSKKPESPSATASSGALRGNRGAGSDTSGGDAEGSE
ncbi:hypothetical protein ABGB19_07530 [Mycobacterium sp. B14F4]|uniref:hypothetical protein n=1 Tax=Mycobacterium sp. B14F4 TaxID=3153565 RepID=UPI00325C406E